jgi:hypothetical protein
LIEEEEVRHNDRTASYVEMELIPSGHWPPISQGYSECIRQEEA